MKLNKLNVIVLFTLYCLYFFIYLIIYNSYVTKIYGYMGYVDNLAISNIPFALVAILLCTILAGSAVNPSTFFLHLALGTVVVPSLVLYCGANLPSIFYMVSFLAYVVVALTSKFLNFKNLNFLKTNNLKLLKILSIVSIGSIVAIVLLGGGRFLNFNFAAVYEVRADAAKNLPGIFGYVNSAVGKVIIPFGIVIAVLLRQWIYVFVLFSSAILLFGLTAHKSILFYPLLVLFFYYTAGKKRALQYFIIALIFIGLVSLVEFYFADSSHSNYWFGNLLVRRSLFTPSMLNWFYIDWFSRNDFYYWSDSKLSFGLVDSPSTLRSVNLIGLNYFGRDEMSANTGWIGSGYSNAGLAGVFVYSLAIGLLLSILNSYAKKLGSKLVISLFVVLAVTILTSTDLITSLLTHGLLLALFLMSLMQPVMSSSKKK